MDDAAIRVLEGARAKRVPWPEVAQTLEKLENLRLLEPSGRPWVKACAELSGYEVYHLRRFQVALRFVDKITSENPAWTREKIVNIGFAALEYLARIYSIDERTGLDNLERTIAGNVRSRDLAQVLRSLTVEGRLKASPISAGRVAAQVFRDRCFAAVGYTVDGNDVAKAIWVKSGMNYPSPEYLVIHKGESGRSKLIGVDVLNLQGDDYTGIIKKRAFPETNKATFLDVLWIISVGGQETMSLVAILGELGRHQW